jgi:hypothetical protein
MVVLVCRRSPIYEHPITVNHRVKTAKDSADRQVQRGVRQKALEQRLTVAMTGSVSRVEDYEAMQTLSSRNQVPRASASSADREMYLPFV